MGSLRVIEKRNLVIDPFTPATSRAGAALLAARIARTVAPMRRPDTTTLDAVLGELGAAPGAAGVIAEVDGRPAGYLIGRPVLAETDPVAATDFPPGSFVIPQEGHAVVAGSDGWLIRRMYAELARMLVDRRLLNHQVTLPARDREGLAAWFSLGFGSQETGALRRVTAMRAPAVDVEIRRVGPEAIDETEALSNELNRHVARSPAFLPTGPGGAEAWRVHAIEDLADPANAFFVAYRDGQAVGMATFMDPWAFSQVFRPEPLVYLYQGVVYPGERGRGTGRALVAAGMRWAGAQGYQWCGLHWDSANLTAARFWPSLGFRPIEYRVARHIDPRIISARG